MDLLVLVVGIGFFVLGVVALVVTQRRAAEQLALATEQTKLADLIATETQALDAEKAALAKRAAELDAFEASVEQRLLGYQRDYLPLVQDERDRWKTLYDDTYTGLAAGQHKLIVIIEGIFKQLRREMPPEIRAVVLAAQGMAATLKQRGQQPVRVPDPTGAPRLIDATASSPAAPTAAPTAAAPETPAQGNGEERKA